MSASTSLMPATTTPDLELSPSSTLRSPHSARTACSSPPSPASPKGLPSRRNSIPPPLALPAFTPPPPRTTLPRRRARKAVFTTSPVSTEFIFVAPTVESGSSVQEAIVPMHLLLPTEPSPPPSVARPRSWVGSGRPPPVALRVLIQPREPPAPPAKPARVQLPRRKVRKAAVLEVVVPSVEEVIATDGPSPPPGEARLVTSTRRAPVHLRIVTDFNAPVIPACGRPQLPRRRTRKALEDVAVTPLPAFVAPAVREPSPMRRPSPIPAVLETPTLAVMQAAAGLTRMSEWRPSGAAPLRLPRRRTSAKATVIHVAPAAEEFIPDVVATGDSISTTLGQSSISVDPIPTIAASPTKLDPTPAGPDLIPALVAAVLTSASAPRPLPRMKRRRAPVFAATPVDPSSAVLCAA